MTAPAILDEIERVLKYPKIAGRHGLPAVRVRALVIELAYFSLVTPGRLRLDVVRDDPADNRYLEAAVEAEAAHIVRALISLATIKDWRRNMLEC